MFVIFAGAQADVNLVIEARYIQVMEGEYQRFLANTNQIVELNANHRVAEARISIDWMINTIKAYAAAEWISQNTKDDFVGRYQELDGMLANL
ncbi:hypothetical protein FJ366_02090 [Candidatus Dependentiae bacterium]|nr:hypothetical protein [Candidatus Dependentiae bacterium]